MEITIFETPTQRGFTNDANGNNIPLSDRPWVKVKKVKIMPHEKSRIGYDPQKVMTEIRRNGFFVHSK